MVETHTSTVCNYIVHSSKAEHFGRYLGKVGGASSYSMLYLYIALLDNGFRLDLKMYVLEGQIQREWERERERTKGRK